MSTRLLDSPTLAATLAAIRAAVEAGAGGELAALWTADAARALGQGRDGAAMLRRLADRLRSSVTYTPDEYGVEDVQGLEETIRRKAGDCDDLTVALAALGRRAGVRPGVSVFLRDTPDGPTAVHALPAFEIGGEWIPVELSRPVPFGSWPSMGPGEWQTYALAPRSIDELGNPFAALAAGALTAGASIFGAAKSAEAAKDATRSAERIARDEQAALVGAAKLAADSAERIEAEKSARVAAILAFAKRAGPFLLGLVGLGVVGRVLGKGRR